MSRSFKHLAIRPAGGESEESDEDMDFSYSKSYGSSVTVTEQELKIKIVPDVGWRAGMNGQHFDIKLDENIAVWFEGFKENFKLYKKGPIISDRLQLFYSSTQNPFIYALKLFANSPEFNAPKSNSLAFTVIEELASYKRNNSPQIDQIVDNNLRMVAFNFIKKQGQSSLFKLVANTYEFRACRDIFTEKVREMVANKQYKEAGQIAIDLELFDEFTIHDFVMPLFMQDKISIAEDYLNKAIHLQRPIVQLLDSFFDKNDSVENNSSVYIAEHRIADVYYGKLHFKPLSKLVLRLAKNYNVAKELTPNVNKIKNFGALQFLVNKKYIEKSLNKDSWEEMVKETVPKNVPELQIELVTMCSQFGDNAEGAKWAQYFDIPLRELPLLVQDYIIERTGTSSGSADSKKQEESWDDEEVDNKESVHTLFLDESRVHLIDDRDKFYKMLKDLRSQEIVAFDSEWKPTFCSTNDVALIQMATRQNVYLIDVMLLNLKGEDWAALAKNVFNNDEILKLGFAPATDISMFQKSIPALNILYNAQTSSSILDLQDLWKHIVAIRGFKFPYQEDYTSQNLSCLVKLCLGKKLDKSNQFSNWSKRPLRKEQLDYAALDAFCLLEIYDIIGAQLSKLNIDSNELLNSLLTESKLKIGDVNKKRNNQYNPGRSEQNRSKNYYRDQQQPQHSRHQSDRNRNSGGGGGSRYIPPGPNVKSVFVSEVKFVCDTMLEGLAKTLRRFGIDTVAVGNREDHDKCVFIAASEKRYILTRGHLYDKFQQYVPPGYCYCLSNDRVEDQLVEVLKYFKISVKLENVFSRCQICNSPSFLTATQGDVYYLKYGKEMPNSFLSVKRGFIGRKENRSKLDRTWNLNPLEEEHKVQKVTSTGAKIITDQVSDAVITNIDFFYVCDGCGKCYWDGSHLDSILEGHFKDVLSLKFE